jgi:hypothetical protein
MIMPVNCATYWPNRPDRSSRPHLATHVSNPSLFWIVEELPVLAQNGDRSYRLDK